MYGLKYNIVGDTCLNHKYVCVKNQEDKCKFKKIGDDNIIFHVVVKRNFTNEDEHYKNVRKNRATLKNRYNSIYFIIITTLSLIFI